MPASVPVPRPTQRSEDIRGMFADIAPRYDVLNRILSGGTDILWRRRAAREGLAAVEGAPPRRILDLACGTGDLALELRRQSPGAQVYGADFTRAMLSLAREKSPRAGRAVRWVEADGLHLPFADATFDLVTIAFGIRNMESLDRGLREMRRVLRPGGALCVLEFTPPENALVRSVVIPYFLHVLPRVGAALSRKSAYLYLPHSILHFPARRELAARMRANGLRRVRHATLQFGVAAIHVANR